MVVTTSQATKVFTHRKSARKRYAYTSSWKDKDLMKCIIWDEEKHKIGRPLSLTNISLMGKAEKPLKEYSELHIKNNNAKYIDGTNQILLTFWQDLFSLLTWSIINRVIRHSEVKVGKRKVKKMKRKILRTVMKQLGTSFVKLLKFILSYKEKYIQQ